MATYIKANNLTNLDVTGSWTTAGVPTSGDLASFTNVFNTAGTLTTTGDLTVGKLSISNTAQNISISHAGTLYLNADYSVDAGVAIEVASAYAYLLTITGNLSFPTSSTIKTGPANLVLSGSGGKTLSVVGDLTVATAGGVNPSMQFQDFGDMSISGSLIVNSGVTATLSYTNADRVTANGTVIAQSSATIGTLAGSGTVELASFSNLYLSSFGSYSGAVVTSFSFQQSNLVVNATSDTSFGGIISRGGSLSKSGSGTLTLSGANTYSGKTYLGAGTIDARNNTALGSNQVIVEAESTIKNGATATTVTLANDLFLSADLNVGAVGAGKLVFSGDVDCNGNALKPQGLDEISGAFIINPPVVKSGTGTLVLSGSNNTGSFTLRGGAVKVTSATAMGVAGDSVTFGNGYSSSLGNANATLLTLADYFINIFGDAGFLGDGPLSTGGSEISIFYSPTITAFYQTVTIPGVIKRPVVPGNTGVVQIGNFDYTHVIFSGTSNTFTGGVDLTGILEIAGDGSLGATPGAFDADNIIFNGGSILPQNSITFGANRGFLVNTAGSVIGSNGFSIGGVISGAGVFYVANSGTNTLTGTNTHTGGTAFIAGTTTFSSGSVGTTGNITFENSPIVIWDGSNTYDISSRAVINGTPTLKNLVGVTFDSSFVSWSGSTLTIQDSSLTFGASASNTGSHNLVVTNSTVTINNNAALGSNSTLSIDDNTTADVYSTGLHGFGFYIGSTGTNLVRIYGDSCDFNNGIVAGFNATITFQAAGSKSFGYVNVVNTLLISSGVGPQYMSFTGSTFTATNASILTTSGTLTFDSSVTITGTLTLRNFYTKVTSSSPLIGDILLDSVNSGFEVSGGYPSIAVLQASVNSGSVGYIALPSNSSEAWDRTGHTSLMLGVNGYDATFSGAITDPGNGYWFYASAGTFTVSSSLTGSNDVLLWGSLSGYLELIGSNTNTGTIDSITGSSYASNILVSAVSPYSSFTQIRTRELKITAQDTLSTPIYAARLTNVGTNTLSGALTNPTTGIIVAPAGDLHISGSWVASPSLSARMEFQGAGNTYLDGTMSWGTGSRAQIYKVTGTGDVVITGTFASSNTTSILFGATNINAGRIIAASNGAFNTGTRTLSVSGSSAGTAIIGMQGSISLPDTHTLSCTATTKVKYSGAVSGDPTTLSNISGNNTFAGTIRSTTSTDSELHIRSESGSMTVGSATKTLTFTSASLSKVFAHVLNCKNSATMDVASKITGQVPANVKIIKTGLGSCTISNATNDFTAKPYLLSGTTSISTLGTGGSASYLGTSSSIALGGKIDLSNSTPETVNKSIEIWGLNPEISASGTDNVTVNSSFTIGDGGSYSDIGGTTFVQAAPSASGSTISVSFPELVSVGMTVASTSIPSGVTVTAVDVENQTITLSQSVTLGSTSETLTLSGGSTLARKIGLGGSSTGTNTLATVLANIGSTPVGLRKTGPGTWYVTQSNSGATGPTSLEAGTMNISLASGLGSGDITISGGSLVCADPSTTKLSTAGSLTLTGGSITL